MRIRKKETPFETAPEGTHPALITVVADLGLQENGYGNRRPMLGIAFELGKPKTKTGSPFAVFETYTASLHEKGNLHPVIRAALGSVPEDELDPKDLLGKSLLLEVVHRVDRDGKTWANTGSVLALPESTTPPETETPLLFFDLDQADSAIFPKLPALFRKKIENRVQEDPEEEEPETVVADSGFEDDLPF